MKRFTALVFAMLLASGCSTQPESQTPAIGPRIAFDQEEFDFGPVAEGIELKHVFKITNTGTETLQITKAASTCGCTIAKLPKSTLNPGASTRLTVELDTSMKQGEVTKTVDVDSDDPDRPKVILAMHMDVENRHKSLSEHSKAKFLTDEKCINCHVAQGVGLFGEELYKADCGMCHGEDAQGKVGPSLIRDYKDPAVRNYVLEVTAHGSKRHASMPGFLEDSGGPLAKVQIDSIIEYLATLKEKK